MMPSKVQIQRIARTADGFGSTPLHPPLADSRFILAFPAHLLCAPLHTAQTIHARLRSQRLSVLCKLLNSHCATRTRCFEGYGES